MFIHAAQVFLIKMHFLLQYVVQNTITYAHFTKSLSRLAINRDKKNKHPVLKCLKRK